VTQKTTLAKPRAAEKFFTQRTYVISAIPCQNLIGARRAVKNKLFEIHYLFLQAVSCHTLLLLFFYCGDAVAEFSSSVF
jgi:hypothetical protein